MINPLFAAQAGRPTERATGTVASTVASPAAAYEARPQPSRTRDDEEEEEEEEEDAVSDWVPSDEEGEDEGEDSDGGSSMVAETVVSGRQGGLGYYTRPLAGMLAHLDKLKVHGPKRITALSLTFDEPPVQKMNEPDNSDWELWQAVAVKLTSASGSTAVRVFRPTLQKNCPKLAAAAAAAGGRTELSGDQLRALRACLFGKGLKVSVANAAMLARLADAAGYEALLSAVRTLYGQAAATAERCAARSRERAQAAYAKALQAARNARTKAEADAHAEYDRRVAAAAAARSKALAGAKRKEATARLRAEQRRDSKKAFLYHHPL